MKLKYTKPIITLAGENIKNVAIGGSLNTSDKWPVRKLISPIKVTNAKYLFPVAFFLKVKWAFA